MTQAIEYLYEYGNFVINIDKLGIRNSFEVLENGEISIIFEKIFSDKLVEKFELTVENGLDCIAKLLYYSFDEHAKFSQNVFLSFDEREEVDKNKTLIAINILYNQLISMLSTEPKRIESLAKCSDNSKTLQSAMLSRLEYVPKNEKNLSIKEIMVSLLEEYDIYSNALIKAISLWRLVTSAPEKESDRAFDEFNKHLNKLYIKRFDTPEKRDLNNLGIHYEFLTSNNYEFNPAVSYEEEVRELALAILVPSKSALLVGPPGVGKTAIVEGLAHLISTNKVPNILKGKKILKVNTSSIISGCTLVGMLEEKVEKLMQYLLQNPNVILFVDELHTAIGSGTGQKGNLDLANLIKPYLDRGRIKIIGATTQDEYEKYMKSDSAFNRRFEKVPVKEPKDYQIKAILRENITRLEKITNIIWNFDFKVTEKIIDYIIKSTDEKCRVYNDKRYNPDISITILEKAFAIALLEGEESILISNIADSIKKCEVLYESTRHSLANQLLIECQTIDECSDTNRNKCRVFELHFNSNN